MSETGHDERRDRGAGERDVDCAIASSPRVHEWPSDEAWSEHADDEPEHKRIWSELAGFAGVVRAVAAVETQIERERVRRGEEV